MVEVVFNLMQKKITWHSLELHKYHPVFKVRDNNVKKEDTKGH